MIFHAIKTTENCFLAYFQGHYQTWENKSVFYWNKQIKISKIFGLVKGCDVWETIEVNWSVEQTYLNYTQNRVMEV